MWYVYDTYVPFFLSWIRFSKWSLNLIQLTLEHHGIELHRSKLHGSTYARIFSNSKCYSTTQPAVGWMHRCGTTYMDRGTTYILSAGYKLYSNFWLGRVSMLCSSYLVPKVNCILWTAFLDQEDSSLILNKHPNSILGQLLVFRWCEGHCWTETC